MKDIKNFAVLQGDVTIKNGVIIHTENKNENTDISTSTKKPSETQTSKGSIVRSNVDFYNGLLEFKVKFKDELCGCLVSLNPLNEIPVGVGVSRDFKKFVVPNDPIYLTAGSLKNYDLAKELTFKIEVLGSNIKLFVNDVLINQGQYNFSNAPLTFKLSGSYVKLFDVKYETLKPKVFVVMQFSDEYNILYRDVIFPICESYDLETIRADEFFTSSPILKDIIDSIKSSALIIAEITPDNPNVFYEIGYSHALNKPTIILCDKRRDKLPFDLSGFRTLFYENSIGGKNKIEKDLKKFIETIFNK